MEEVQPPVQKKKSFFKTIPGILLALGILAVSGYALLTVYITISGSATVGQSVLLDAIESTWKYPLKTLQYFQGGVTTFDLGRIGVVSGDEQDIGILLSNYAENRAPVNIVKSIKGPVETTYQMCIDDTAELYDDYNPSNLEECQTIDYDTCTENPRCEWIVPAGTNGYCKGNEHCYGDPMTMACVDDVWTGTTVLAPRNMDTGEPSETWYCIRDTWNIAATPGTYGITVSVEPTTLVP